MKLAEWRKREGLTLDQLSERWGVPRSTIYNWETDERTPRLKQLLNIQEWTAGEVTINDFAPTEKE